MSFLELENITKQYRGESEPCVHDLNFTVEEGEIAVLLGSSGCGKTTTLKMIAGLEKQNNGHVFIDGELMDGIAPEKRPISMVFQKSLLFTNMTVEQNVNFSPRVNHTMPRKELAKKTEEMLELVGLGGLGRKKAVELSGGQEQRVSLARALMAEPKLLLLDEPLSALDASLRESMQQYIRQLNHETGVTMVFVTHDQREAVAVADRLAVMNEGKLIQIGKPQDFYTHPNSHFVAEFFGWKNFVPAKRVGSHVSSILGEYDIEGIEKRGNASDDIEADCAAEEGELIIRPEAAINIGNGSLQAVVTKTKFEGMVVSYDLVCDNIALHMSLPPRYNFTEGAMLSFDLDPSLLWFVV